VGWHARNLKEPNPNNDSPADNFAVPQTQNVAGGEGGCKYLMRVIREIKPKTKNSK